MMNKYRWSTSTINNIAWKYYATIINSQSYPTQRTMRKFVHRWLSPGSHNRGEALLCPFCKILEGNTMSHDHFLQCLSSTINKQKRLQLTENLLNHLHTPKQLIEPILRGISRFYNNQDRKETDQQQRCTKQNIVEAKSSELDYGTCIIYQDIIGWEHFARGRINKYFIDTVNRYYQRGTTKGRTFTGVGWIKTVARHMLIIHVEA